MNSIEKTSVRKKIGDYSYMMADQIGKGYSSQVYKGCEDSTGTSVAIKVINLNNSKNKLQAQMLISEISALQALRHCEHIIELQQSYNSVNNTYIITQLCSDGDLSQFINICPLKECRAIQLLQQIIIGYLNIESGGFVHRDLKPSNIFLNNGSVCIADFGFACRKEECQRDAAYNVGSPIYMPPEALKDNSYSPKSDIWALGIIFYQMLTGHTPWKAKSQNQLIRKLKTISIRSLLPKGLSKTSIKFLTKALTTSISERMSPDDLRLFSFTECLVSQFSVEISERSKDTIKEIDQNYYVSNDNDTTIKKGTVKINKRDRKSLPKTSATIRNTEQVIEGPLSINELPSGKLNSKNIPLTSKYLSPQSKYQSLTSKLLASGKVPLSKLQNMSKLQSPTLKLQSPTSKAEVGMKLQSGISKVGSPLVKIQSGKKLQELMKSVDENMQEKEMKKIDNQKIMKQLQSKIDLSRFMEKLLERIINRLTQDINRQLKDLKDNIISLINYILQKVQNLEGVSEIHKQQFKLSEEYQIIKSSIINYKDIWKNKLGNQKYNSNYALAKKSICDAIRFLYHFIDGNVTYKTQEIIVLDYLLSLCQLLTLENTADLKGFHAKSKIKDIVEGTPAKNIGMEHLKVITRKLKTFKIIK